MSDCDDLIRKAYETKRRGLRFNEEIRLAECAGFRRARQRGSHLIMKRPGFPRLLNFQPDANGMAKPAQVRELLDAIGEIKELEGQPKPPG
jgi:hypothetical protein